MGCVLCRHLQPSEARLAHARRLATWSLFFTAITHVLLLPLFQYQPFFPLSLSTCQASKGEVASVGSHAFHLHFLTALAAAFFGFEFLE